MAEVRVERRLSAILAADVVGYSRLVGMDEEGTIARLKILREELIDPSIARHGGRIVKTMGDGVLVEFPSVVDAVRNAVEVQRALAEREADEPEDRRIEFRVGVNLGDIIIDGDDILGDGVNIAARLEGLAEPGGICVSGDVYRQARGKADVGFEDLGERQVKNIAEPVRVYRVLIEPGVTDKVIDETKRAAPSWMRVAPVAAAIVLIAIAGAVAWLRPWEPTVEPVTAGNTAFPLRGGPSIAVLAFQNMSDDTSQEYFADGIAEDIITDLSKISSLFVTARNSSFRYRGRSVDVVQIGRELGVRYILEGSVRRAEDQVRITAQLIDAETGGHVWAERYDGSLGDVFALQDRVTSQIIDALKLQLTPSERLAVDTHGTVETAAYDAYLRGLSLLSDRRRVDVDANLAAQAKFEEAIRIDPDYALAFAGLAWAKWLHFESISIVQSTDEIFALAEKSIALNDNALAHRTLSKKHFSLQLFLELTTRKMDLAVAELEAARQLQPADPDILVDLATALSFAGRPQEAPTLIQKAMELNPSHPDWYFGPLGIALLLAGNPERAVGDLRTWSRANPSWHVPYLFLTAALANSGDQEAAKTALARYSELYYPGSIKTLRSVRNSWPMAPEQEEVFQRGLRLAGMKETPG